MNRRRFIVAATGGPLLASSVKRAGQDSSTSFELEEATIRSLQESMATGSRTARSIAELYLARISKIDRSGPELRSIIELNPDVLRLADALDSERKARGARGPLHGIPVLLKDNINTTGPMTTTAGSLALEGSIPPIEADISRRLRDAGALILGKSNMSEWANFRSSRSTSGWSARGGQCRNPYVLDRSPLGSSSGSAVAAAASLCAGAVGTETDGSIVVPSSVCGVVGFKPTVGRMSTTGIIPVAHSQDAPGPISRTVEDAAILMTAMTGTTDFTRFLQLDGLKGARIGVARKLFVADPGVERLMTSALDTIKRLGADLIELSEFGTLPSREIEVLLYEFKADINAYFSTLSAPFRSLTLRSLVEFNERNRSRELAYFGQELFQRAESMGSLTEPDYRQALAECRRIARTEGIDRAVSRYRLDSIVAPTGGPAGLIAPGQGDRYLGRAPTIPAVAGYPHITVPAGFVGDLPIGLSFFGPANTEGTLFRFAFAFEQATRLRRTPTFLSTGQAAGTRN